MMSTDEHSDTYYLIIDAIKHPKINFIGIQPETDDEKAEAQKAVLHNFVNHHYMDHDLTEDEANDLHAYVDERKYDV